jgi:hypothetical protein
VVVKEEPSVDVLGAEGGLDVVDAHIHSYFSAGRCRMGGLREQVTGVVAPRKSGVKPRRRGRAVPDGHHRGA